jgi:hypothetical protein
MKAIRIPSRLFARNFFACFLWLGAAIFVVSPRPVSIASPTVVEGECRTNLLEIFRAVQEHRRLHHDLPEELGALVSANLLPAHRLVCPITKGREAGRPAVVDPGNGRNEGYTYEFARKPLTNALARSVGLTLRDWRRMQMGRIGSEVPLVRCANHSPVLNLSFGGSVYESAPEWEERFSSLVPVSALSADGLLSEYPRLAVVRIPARSPGLPRELVDLTSHYNGSLNGWLEWSLDDNLAELPAGLNRIGHHDFDVRGVIQLGSMHYAMLHRPMAVSNILVGLKCDRLLFLHGTVNTEADGMVISQYVIQFVDGSRDAVTNRFGQDVLNWRVDPDNNRRTENVRPVWSASAKGRTERRTRRLFLTLWINPRPDALVRSLDILSAPGKSSPFLVAITAERIERSARTGAGDTNKQ